MSPKTCGKPVFFLTLCYPIEAELQLEQDVQHSSQEESRHGQDEDHHQSQHLLDEASANGAREEKKQVPLERSRGFDMLLQKSAKHRKKCCFKVSKQLSRDQQHLKKSTVSHGNKSISYIPHPTHQTAYCDTGFIQNKHHTHPKNLP